MILFPIFTIFLVSAPWATAEETVGTDPLLSQLADLINAADSLQNDNQLDSALVLSRHIIERASRDFGTTHPIYASALNVMGVCQFFLGNYTECESLWTEATELRENILEPGHPDIAQSYNNLGNLALDKGNYQEAILQYGKALEIWENAFGPDDIHVAKVLSNLANAHSYLGEYEKAEPLYTRSLALRRKHQGLTHPEVALTLNLLGTLYHSQGKYSDAERSYRKSLEIYELKEGPPHPEMGMTINNLGNLYSDEGKYRKAVPLLKRAVALWEKTAGPDHLYISYALTNLATIYLYQGRHESAEVSCRKALEIRQRSLGPDHPDVGLSLNTLANILAAREQYDEAEHLHLRTIEIFTTAYGAEHPYTAFARSDLGNLFLEKGLYEAADTILTEAVRIFERTLGPDHPYVANALNSMADLKLRQGEYGDAISLQESAIGIMEESLSPNHPDIARGYGVLSKCHGALGEVSQYQAFFRKQQQSRRNFINYAFAHASEDQKLRYLETYPLIEDFFITLAIRSPSEEAYRAALDMILQGKAVIIDAMSSEKEVAYCSYDEDLIERMEKHSAVCSEIASLTIGRSENVAPQFLRDRLKTLHVLKDSLEIELSRRCTEFREENILRSFSMMDVANLIPENALLLEFIRYEPYAFERTGSDRPRSKPARYAVFSLDHTNNVTLVELDEAATIDSLVDTVRSSIYGARSYLGDLSLVDLEERYSDLSSALYRILLSPLEGRLEGKEDLYISPDGQLSLLPFEILVCPDGEYLVEKHSISYLSSGREILRFERERDRGEGALVVADPTFDLSGEDMAASRTRVLREEEGEAYALGGTRGVSECLGEKFGRLSSTREEGILVRDALEDAGVSGVRCYDGEEALEEVVKGCRQAPRVLHIATHGFFCEDAEIGGGRIVENPLLRCGLALTGANRVVAGESIEGSEDGILTAFEVSGLNLVGTELAVLSACETGVGEVRNGEGVYGLRRVFQYAGAETIVMSLWKVPDEETVELMRGFYERWLSGMRKKDALRESILSRIAEERERYGTAHPLLWGGFILTGNPE